MSFLLCILDPVPYESQDSSRAQERGEDLFAIC